MTQTQILEACDHSPKSIETSGGIRCCVECWNRGAQQRKADRKAQLTEYWFIQRAKQASAMDSAGAQVGDLVSYFAPSMLGPAFGGLRYTGQIIRNRNGYCVVKLDSPSDGKSIVPWNVGWALRGKP